MKQYIDKAAIIVTKLRNSMRKKFRIVNNEVYCPEAFHPFWYRIEQRYSILFFLHWWGTPEFEPPHNFEFVCDAIRHIKKHFPNAIIYDYYSENKCKK
jgi:hypothetical protein